MKQANCLVKDRINDNRQVDNKTEKTEPFNCTLGTMRE